MSGESEALQKNMQLMDEQNQHNETRSKHRSALKRALKAETDVATLRALVADAQWLLNAYGLIDALPAPSPIAHWLQRAQDALESIPDLKGK